MEHTHLYYSGMALVGNTTEKDIIKEAAKKGYVLTKSEPIPDFDKKYGDELSAIVEQHKPNTNKLKEMMEIVDPEAIMISNIWCMS